MPRSDNASMTTSFFKPKSSSKRKALMSTEQECKEIKSYTINNDQIIFTDDAVETQDGVLPSQNGLERKLVPADEVEKAHAILSIEGIQVKFPFRPYPCQIQLMSKVLKCLKSSTPSKKEHALLESPTGTGKTMSLLCSTLAWLEAVKAAEKIRPAAPVSYPDELVIHSSLSVEDDPITEGSIEEASLPRILFASRTHKQLSQVVRELRRSSYCPKFTVLASRTHYCINERVRRARDINDACFEAITNQENHCSFINRVEKFMRRSGDEAVSRNVEELVSFGKNKGLCPYFVSREVADRHAEIVLCPFDYIVSPGIREAMGVDLKNAVVIFDEAHNIEDVCREAGGVEITNGQLVAIRSELNTFFDALTGAPLDTLLCPSEHMTQQAAIICLLDWLEKSPFKTNKSNEFEREIEIWEGQDILDNLLRLNFSREYVSDLMGKLLRIDEKRKVVKDGNAQSAIGYNDFGEDCVAAHSNREDDAQILSQGSSRLLKSLYGTLLFVYQKENLPSYRFVRQREYRIGIILSASSLDKDRGKHAILTLGLWCLNPSVVFKEITSLARSVILTSGTLSPMETFGSELSTHFENRLEAQHILSPSQIWVGAVSHGPKGCELKGTFKELETFAFQDDIATSILDVVQVVPDGILCFLPSYFFLDKLIKRMESTGTLALIKRHKKVFSEPKQGSAQDFEKLMRSYYANIESKRGAIFFAVFRGKVSEGLDFADENARAVISVGIPFPALKDERVVQKRIYNDQYARERGLLNGNMWYDKQAYRALNQALGRCIRHRNDWGAIILLDRRFHYESNISGLSKWMRPMVSRFSSHQEAMASLAAYLQTMKNRQKDGSIDSNALPEMLAE